MGGEQLCFKSKISKCKLLTIFLIINVKKKSTFFMLISLYFDKKTYMQELRFNNDLLNNGTWDD